jgi:hypothetical protein
MIGHGTNLLKIKQERMYGVINMLTVESSRNKDLIIKTKNTPKNLMLLEKIVEVLNMLDVESTFQLNKGETDNDKNNNSSA